MANPRRVGHGAPERRARAHCVEESTAPPATSPGHVRRARMRFSPGPAVALLAAGSFLPVTLGGIASTGQAAACSPAVHVLPMAPGDNEGNVVAMNDRGWAIGYSTNRSGTENPFHTLLWRGPGAPADLGFGRRVNDDGSEVSGSLVDINKRGVVAVQRNRRSPSGVVAASALLWHDGEVTRLPRGRRDNDATIRGLNDYGTAVGSLNSLRPQGLGRAVVWRDGKLIRLPVPRGALSFAHQINNHGLVTGAVRRPDQLGPPRPWFWRIGRASGPLTVPDSYVGLSTLVDNRDRIVMTVDSRGFGGTRQLLFNRPWSEPRLLDHRKIEAMNDGDVVGYYEDDHAIEHRSWVARLHSTRHVLPLPEVVPPVEGFFGWTRDTYANSVIRGVTEFAPQGGVSVGGFARALTDGGEDYNLPAIWTCVATS